MPAGAEFLRSVAFVGSQGWACGRNGTIIRTPDAGVHWTLQPTNVDTTLFDIEFGDTLRGMVAGNSVVLYTTDGGNTWVRGLGGIGEASSLEPQASSLRIEPNPVAGGYATIRFSLARHSSLITRHSSLRVFDALGRCALSVPVTRSPSHLVTWSLPLDLRGLPGGVYLARLSAGTTASTAKFILLPAVR
jgi:hypothetical protein